MARKEPIGFNFHTTVLTISVRGALYASSPTTREGIEAMIKATAPSDAAIEARAELKMEQPATNEQLAEQIEGQTATTLEDGKSPSTVFRRDEQDRPFLHSNYLKGHLRECGEVLSRIIGMWGVKDLVTRTLFIAPDRIYLKNVGARKTYFTPEIRLPSGVMVKQPTEKIAEYVENPVLTWTLYMAADPRWSKRLLEQMLTFGAMRGLGPGRGIDTSKYDFSLLGWETIPAEQALSRYQEEFNRVEAAVLCHLQPREQATTPMAEQTVV